MSKVLKLSPDDDALALTAALENLCDSWMRLSLVLRDKLTETDSPQRDEVMAEVERYLARLQEFERRLGS